MIGCWPASFSRLAASVEKPVFVFFCGVRPSSSKSTSRSCGVELTLNSWPAASTMASRWRSTSATSRSRSACSSSPVDADADVLHAGQHADEGHLDVVVERAQPLGVERREQRRDEPVDGERAPAPPTSRPGWSEPSRSSWPSAATSPSGMRAPGVADDQLLEQVAALRRDRGGRRRARCRGPGCARRRRGR